MSLQIFSNDNAFLREALSEVELLSWSFSNQILTVNLEIYDTEEDLFLYINTDIVLAEKLYDDCKLNICRLEIIKVDEILSHHKGYYIPPNNFGELMKYRLYSMFYGEKTDKKYCLSLVGSKRFITFPVKDFSDITWEIK